VPFFDARTRLAKAMTYPLGDTVALHLMMEFPGFPTPSFHFLQLLSIYLAAELPVGAYSVTNMGQCWSLGNTTGWRAVQSPSSLPVATRTWGVFSNGAFDPDTPFWQDFPLQSLLLSLANSVPVLLWYDCSFRPTCRHGSA